MSEPVLQRETKVCKSILVSAAVSKSGAKIGVSDTIVRAQGQLSAPQIGRLVESFLHKFKYCLVRPRSVAGGLRFKCSPQNDLRLIKLPKLKIKRCKVAVRIVDFWVCPCQTY